MQRRSYRVHGRVQGVGFRYTAAQLANRHRLTGSVQNLPDGTVALVVQGEPEALAAFLTELSECFEGYISRWDETTMPVEPDELGFQIVR
ncbi:MAG: hypothetical protein KatS3mg114_1232 [Planctomycetaceae bacterium]|nr:MAG: hypothetical protein KatS3mg114_1232 [Planctomycetaceae bacterium]